MKYTQLAVIESPGGCNYAARHPACPAGMLGRDKPAAEPMKAKVAVDIAVELASLGFRGYYAFHWYNEPLVSRAWVEEVMYGIRQRIPARFVLWTNGSLIKQDDWDWTASFDRVFISNYNGDNWEGLGTKCARTGCILLVRDYPHLDSRVVPPALGQVPRRICYRPYTEIVVTRDGNVHLCCMAWRPEQSLGNVLTDGVAECVRRFQEHRRDAVSLQRPVCEGHPCPACPCPGRLPLDWDHDIYAAAMKHAKDTGQ